MPGKGIIAFEHDTLAVSRGELSQEQFNALVKYNDLHGSKYFTVGFNKITFKSYVGVLQVGNRTIEILPKLDGCDAGEDTFKWKWQRALLSMLQKAGYIKMNELKGAFLSVTKENLLDIYLHTFLKEVDKIVHFGLLKKYRLKTDNGKALKGRLLISKQIQSNLIHKEKFCTEHAVYDANNIYNGVLKSALSIVQSYSSNQWIKRAARRSFLNFDNVDKWKDSASKIGNLRFDRKTERYRDAVALAELIIRNYCPDFSSGDHHILAILFDMNKLFEKYIYACLKEHENGFKEFKLSVSGQQNKIFWGQRTIRPDIIVRYRKPAKEEKDEEMAVIVDTKWKVIDDDYPSGDDLKQMYVYNLQFGALKSVLLYPRINQVNDGLMNFEPSCLIKGVTHGCELYFADLFDESDSLSNTFGQLFLMKMLNVDADIG